MRHIPILLSLLVPLFVPLGAACGNSTAADAGLPVLDSGGLLFPDSGSHPEGIARTCASNSDCGSGACGSNGLCCNAACQSADPVCGTTACSLSGDCQYPDLNTPCGTLCAAGSLNENLCDGKGACGTGRTTTCPAPYGCALGGTACATSCLNESNCAAGAHCNAEGKCDAKQSIGFCTSNDQCSSGRCGVDGSGACCVGACDQTDLICGASGCDPTSGACLYAAEGVGCGAGSCHGSDDLRSRCDGDGNCGSPTSAACPNNLVCEADETRCKLGCLSGADCATGNYCDLGAANPGACCAPPAGNLVFVDNYAGSDVSCCGDGPGALACGSVGRAMQIIRETRSYGATIYATTECSPSGNCPMWGTGEPNSALETYPIQLGFGVTLEAPGVTFIPALTSPAWTGSGSCGGTFSAFWVTPFPEEPAASQVTLRGMTILTDQAVPAVTLGPIANLSFFSLLYFANYGGTIGGNNCPWGPAGTSTAPDNCNPGFASAWIEPDVDAGNPGCQPCVTLPGRSDCEPGRPAAAVLDTVSVLNPPLFLGTPSGPASYPNTDFAPALYVGPGSALTLGPGPVQIALTYDPSDPNERLDGTDCLGSPVQWGSVTDVAGGLTPVLSIGPTDSAGWGYAGKGTNLGLFSYFGVVQSDDASQAEAMVSSSYPGVLPNFFSNEILLGNCNASLTAAPTLGASYDNQLSNPAAWQCNYDGDGITIYQDAGLIFGSPAQPGLIHCMGNHGIFVPGASIQQDPAVSGSVSCPSTLGPSVQVLGATIRNNNGAGIAFGSGDLLVSDTTIVNNDIGVEVDGPDTADYIGSYDWGCGPNSVTLQSDTLACNGSGYFFQPSAETRYRSPMFNYIPAGQSTIVNAGADLWNQWYDPTGATNPVISARKLTWTDYQGGKTNTATCDPISNGDLCFLGEWDNPSVQPLCQCVCSGPSCSFTSIDPSVNSGILPDGLDIVQWGPSFGTWFGTPSTVDIKNGQEVPGGAASYCGNLQFNYSIFGP